MNGKSAAEQKALRIVEALSGVDPKLLERSECRCRAGRNFARAAAACLALAAAGALSWHGLSRMRSGDGVESVRQSLSGEEARGGTEGQGFHAGMPAEPREEAAQEKQDSQEMAGKKEAGGTEGAAWEEPGSLSQSRDADTAADKAADTAVAAECIDSGLETDRESLGSGAIYERITDQEARDTEIFGSYVPEGLPEGYVFESALRHTDGTGIRVVWTRGADSIVLSIRKAPGDIAAVDPEKAEMYDERLYEIPYGETVPQEYREVFRNPVFAAQDLSLEIVKSRMKSVPDAGDTSTPRGEFSILYPDGVLVEFNGRGTAEEIWEMLGGHS